MRIKLTDAVLVGKGREDGSRVEATENVMEPDKVLETTAHCNIRAGKLLKGCLLSRRKKATERMSKVCRVTELTKRRNNVRKRSHCTSPSCLAFFQWRQSTTTTLTYTKQTTKQIRRINYLGIDLV